MDKSIGIMGVAGPVLAMLAACGATRDGGSQEAGARAGSDADAGVTAEAGVDATELVTLNATACPVAPCPSSVPDAGTPCSSAIECEYGDDPQMVCNVTATCEPDGRWSVQASLPSSGRCPTTLPGSCPPTFAVALAMDGGSACSSAFECHYPEGACRCAASGSPVTPYSWQCSAPVAPGCPPTRPRLGTACPVHPGGSFDASGVSCVYGICADSVYCDCGIWDMQLCAFP
jgi:hypothetical protein